MKKTALFLSLMCLVLLWSGAKGQTAGEEKLFQEAKILLFDERWEDAQEKLEEFLALYPRSPLASQAFFYKAKSLGKQKGKEREALKAYEEYLQRGDRNKALAEEAEVSIIDMAFDLYSKGEKSYLRELEERLESPNRVIRYYAAFKLSYMKDKKVASKGIPVLKEIIEEERDAELKDRAKIALLRISPEVLQDVGHGREEERVRILKIRVYVEGKKEPDYEINIPWALADLALRAIPEEDKAALRKEGYDLDKIIAQLTRTRGNIIEIKEKDRTIKIWID